MKEKEIDIITFINKFNKNDKSNVLIKTFTRGYCYYFALILKERFPEGEIYYNTINHFVFKLNNKLYDITGECTNKWNNNFLYNWDKYKKINPEDTEIIIRDCIKKNDII